MGNIEIEAKLVNREEHSIFEKGEACSLAVNQIAGDGLNPPIKYLRINVQTQSDKTVSVTIPNDLTGVARVTIDGEEV